MKKFLKCAVVAVMVLLSAFLIPFGSPMVANAENSSLKKELKLELEVIEQGGDEFIFNVKLNENPGIHSLKMELGYDSDKMMLAAYTDSSVIQGDNKLTLVTPVTEKKEEGYAYMPFVFNYSTGDTTRNVTDTGVILRLRFKLKEGIDDGDHKVSFINTKATYYDSTIQDEEEYELKIDALKINVLNGAVQTISIYDGVDPLIESETLWIILVALVGGLVVILGIAFAIILIKKHKNKPKKVKGASRSVKTAKKVKNSRIKKK